MRDDFCVFILTHGRPDRVLTYGTLERRGYTGKLYLVVDDEDKTRDEYIERFGSDRVLTFSKEEVAKTTDSGDNFSDRRAILYARNACFDLAEQVGCRYFMQLDDDYVTFAWRFNQSAEGGHYQIHSFDKFLALMLDYFISIPALTIAMPQGGDAIGGVKHGTYFKAIQSKRKAMNTFICSTDRRFKFFGKLNEDVSAYTTLGRRGELFLTCGTATMHQKQTQSGAGGMSEIYRDSGTYVKSFYSVMYSPSCVRVGTIGAPCPTTLRADSLTISRCADCRGKGLATRRCPAHASKILNPRMHHEIDWNKTAPKILHERHRKQDQSSA